VDANQQASTVTGETTESAPAAEETSHNQPDAHVQQEERFPYPKEYQYKKEDKHEEAKQENFPYPEEYRFKTEEAQGAQQQDEAEAQRCADEASKKAEEKQERW